MSVLSAWRALFVAILVAVGQLLSVAAPAAAGTVTCDYIGSKHKVKVTMSGGASGTLKRDVNGHIKVNDTWCEGVATVNNTDSIVVLAGAKTQFFLIYLDYSGFRPGFTAERGSSEIEISVSLGGDSDSLNIIGSGVDDHITVGQSSGFGVKGKMNLNANEATGVDADLTLIVGIEEVVIYGKGGGDIITGAGGAGTGAVADFTLKLSGDEGGDQLTGGSVHDSISGGSGPDILKGGAGPDYLDAQDGGLGNDQLFGGAGSDTCLDDPMDSVMSCP